MEAIDAEVLDQMVEIFGDSARLWPRGGIREAPTPTASVERDDALASSREGFAL
jgi:hypothetical protein